MGVVWAQIYKSFQSLTRHTLKVFAPPIVGWTFFFFPTVEGVWTNSHAPQLITFPFQSIVGYPSRDSEIHKKLLSHDLIPKNPPNNRTYNPWLWHGLSIFLEGQLFWHKHNHPSLYIYVNGHRSWLLDVCIWPAFIAWNIIIGWEVLLAHFCLSLLQTWWGVENTETFLVCWSFPKPTHFLIV